MPKNSVQGAGDAEKRATAPHLPLHLAGISWGILALAACLLVPQFRETPLGDLSPAYLGPAIWTAVFTWGLCRLLAGASTAHRLVWRLRLWTVAAVGVAPFVSWWSQIDDNPYLTFMAALSAPAAVTWLYYLVGAVHHLAGSWQASTLEQRARRDQTLVLYLLAAPIVAIWSAGLLAWWVFPGSAILELHKAWHLLPAFLKIAMLMPVLETALLFWVAARRAARIAWTQSAQPEGPPCEISPKSSEC